MSGCSHFHPERRLSKTSLKVETWKQCGIQFSNMKTTIKISDLDWPDMIYLTLPSFSVSSCGQANTTQKPSCGHNFDGFLVKWKRINLKTCTCGRSLSEMVKWDKMTRSGRKYCGTPNARFRKTMKMCLQSYNVRDWNPRTWPSSLSTFCRLIVYRYNTAPGKVIRL